MKKQPRRSLAIGIALLSLPSFLFVWLNRDAPHFGVLQDDGLYLIGAKTIAEGLPYKILSAPGEPYQTKYPPLYPAYLSIAWRMGSAFAGKLSAALILSWLCLPAFLVLFHIWLREHGFGPGPAWMVTGLFALQPYTLFFVSNLGSELLFMVFLLAAVLAAERSRAGFGGMLAGLGYLVRTAGIALLPAAIIYYFWTRQPRKAFLFCAGMIPAIAGWMLWGRAHAAAGSDIVTLCYTNYIGYELFNVTLDNVHLVLWKNFSALLESFGSFVFPQMIGGLPAKLILQPIGLAMILGCVRMFRQKKSLYALFGAFSACILLAWHFAPNQRFVLPLAPLLLAGFWSEAVHFWGLVRGALKQPDRSQRVVAYGFTGFLGLVLAVGAGLQIYMWVKVIPEMARDDRDNTRAFNSVYRWVKSNTPADANILWEDDTALYFAAERHSLILLIPAREWYEHGNEGDLDHYRKIDQYATEHNLGYVILTKMGPHKDDEILKAARHNARLERVHEEAGGVVYKVR